jgi:hypothetical protein
MTSRRVTSQRHGDFFAELKEGTISDATVAALESIVRAAHEIPDSLTVLLHTVVDYEVTPLTSDAAVLNALTVLSDTEALAVTFETTGEASPGRGLVANLVLILNDLASHKEVTFAFTAPTSQSALTKLRADAVKALELPEGTTVSIGVDLSGSVESIPSDRALEELILASADGNEGPLRIVVSVVAQSSSNIVKVNASYAQSSIAASRHAEFSFSFAIDQGGLLGSLKDAARGALEVPNATNVDITATVEGSVTALSSDKVLLNILLEFVTLGAPLNVYVADAVATAPTLKLPSTVTSGTDTVPFEFVFSLEDANLTRTLRMECGAELETTLDDDDVLYFVDANAGEEAAITSDTVLRDILLQLLDGGRTLSLFVRRQVKATVLKRSVKCTMHDETAEFEFRFSMNQNNLLQLLTEEAKAELDLMPSDNIVLSAVVEGDAFVLRNDSEVRELFSQLDAATHVILEAREAAMTRVRSKQVVVSTRSVKVTLDDEEVEFRLRYVVSQDGLLEHILGECKDALDLMPNEDIAIAVRVGSDVVPLNSDGETRELLQFTEDAEGILELVASHAIARQHNAVATMIRKSVACSLDDETANFELNFVVSQDGLLDFLKGECKDALDLMPNEVIRLEAQVEGGQSIPVTTDAILRELLFHEGQLALVAVVGDVRQVVLRKTVLCTLNGETAEFEFRYTIDQEQLLQAFVDECKAELDLLPNEFINVSAVFGEDVVPLQADRALREILAQLEGTFTVHAEEVKAGAVGSPKKAAEQLSVTIGFDVTVGDDTQSIVYRFHPEDSEPLNGLKCLVRGDFDLNPAANITLMLATDPALPSALRTDDDVRALVGRRDVAVHVILPKSDDQLIEERPLHRTAELNALFYDWRDIITTPTVEASDLQLVTSNVKVDGAPLPPTHPVTVKLLSMATDEVVLRVEDQLLPFLETLFESLSEQEASRLCHSCRDVIEFLVDRSPHFRLRRSLSEAFRTVAIKDVVAASLLREQLVASDVPEEDVDTVLQGYPEELTRVQYNDITEQIYGDCPQDVGAFIATITKGKKASNEGQQEVFQLRRNRLLADIRHAFDGVAAVNLVSLVHEDVFRSDDTLADLAWCVSSLSGGPQEKTEALVWINAALQDEVAAYNFIHNSLQFKESSMQLPALAVVCIRLNDADLEPSVLMSRSNALHGLVSWALGAARLACHTRRELFPPVIVLQPRPPSARRKAEALANESEEQQEGSARRLRGLSSPYAIHRFSNDAANGFETDALVVAPPSLDVPRFEPRLRHLSTDLRTTNDGPHTYSLRALMAAQEATLQIEGHADPQTSAPEEVAAPAPAVEAAVPADDPADVPDADAAPATASPPNAEATPITEAAEDSNPADTPAVLEVPEGEAPLPTTEA